MNVCIIVPKTHSREQCPVMPCGLTQAEWDHRRKILALDLADLGGMPVSVRSCTVGVQSAWLYQAHVDPESLPAVARLDLYLRDQFHLTAREQDDVRAICATVGVEALQGAIWDCN